jgi:hypothetical protein
MRYILPAAMLVLAPAWAQIRVPAPPAPSATADRVTAVPVLRVETPSQRVLRAALDTLGKKFDSSLQEIGGDDVQLLGGTRGIYLDGYGAVFTTEISLAYPPARTPFHPTATPLEIKNLHERKVKHLPLVRQAMRDMMMDSAKSLTFVPMNDQIVVSVRLLYLPYEDTAGLPSEIVMKADRKSAIEGDLHTEEQ